MNATIQTVECPKCIGNGFIPAFSGIANGICFTCAGAGKVAFKVKKINKFSPINAMHCKTLAEAQVFRLSEFANRFPQIELSESQRNKIANGAPIKLTLGM